MAYAKALAESYGLNFELILTLTIVLVAAALILLVIMKLFKVAIGVGIAFVLIPMLFTLFFGDGSALIQQAAGYLPPETGQQLEESYDYFKEKESQDQLIDAEKVQEAVDDAKSSMQERLQNLPQDLQKEDGSPEQIVPDSTIN